MKKVLLFGLIVFVLLSAKAVAHAPSSMSISYDSETNELVVVITHSVSNPESHYINNITIEKNNNFYRGFDYISQPSGSSFTYNYSDIVGESGDMFSVVARCNLGGQISKSLTVGSTVDDTGTPGFELVIVVCGILVFILYKRKISKS